MNFRTPAVRLGLLPAGIALALVPSFASAQEAAAGTTDLDRISVTGSRIRGANMETQQPILTMTREALEKQGFSSVADVLNNLTSAGSPAISRSDSLSSGENVGGYYVDIRNLGAQRTLVLMNGKRLGASTSGLQDLSQIPMSAVERIEILKDGASSIYGSDAIAGVVNVITRKNIDGGEASVRVGQFGNGDGDEQQYSMTLGAKGERGSLTLSAEYSKQDPVWAKDRWYSRDGSLGPNSTSEDWSPISQNGSWCNPTLFDCTKGTAVWQTLNAGGNPKNAGDYHELTSDEFANANEQMTLLTGVKRKSVYINGTYDFTDSISLNTDLLYNERQTFQQIAGYPYQSAASNINTPLSGSSAFNPLSQDISFRRRLWEMPRTSESQLKTLRFAPTVSGYFELAGKTFDWDVGALWNRNESIVTQRGDMSLIASQQALGPSFVDAGGVARCGTAANPILGDCRPWNPLLPYGVAGQGSLADQELQEFLFPTFTTRGVTKTTSFTANLAGSIVTLPAGDLGFAMGVEHRKEEGNYVPDAFAQSGKSTGLGQKPTQGEYDLNEVYLELNVPILADMAFAKELTFNVASRYSDYSNFGGTTNSKFGLTWRPMDELLVRGTYAEGFRAPTISDLYGGLSSSFESYIDPCGVTAPGSVAGNGPCSAAGVPANYTQIGQGNKVCSTLPCQSGDQFVSGANPNLTPETSKSKTVGLVWSPRWVQGLDVSLDWYRYEISDMIIEDSVDRILRDCYVLGNSARCEGVVRAPDGHVSALTYGTANLGKMETEGYDLGIKYRLPELAIGQFNIDWQTSYLSKYDEAGENSNGDPIMIGMVGQSGDTTLFRVRSNLGVNWAMGDFGVNYTARYYSGLSESCISIGCTDPNRFANGEAAPLRKTGSNTFHDLQVSWQAPWDATIAVGANNVFDHKGPLMYSAPNSSFAYYGGFDIGRFLYMKYTQRF
ncbi:TonB-dependent receptor [Stenotrophomonas sp. SAM-B]|jgi:iron complex outermembrane receptor protein|uniref:TonB-dependent receptor plug domain-containing protein n=1 Tax=Stenotrophomonas TaxID=40323 RepID=UPI001313B033|nr:TonB-dependent receptor [Stenotrophomonas sp. SAM-B]NWF32039.1 TonB-dependent receptor [Stenotrophomonas sp. SAM-B]